MKYHVISERISFIIIYNMSRDTVTDALQGKFWRIYTAQD